MRKGAASYGGVALLFFGLQSIEQNAILDADTYKKGGPMESIVPVYYKGRKFPFKLNLPWIQAHFQDPNVSAMIEERDAAKLVSMYPESFFVGTPEPISPPEPQPDPPKPEPESEEDSTEEEGSARFVLDFSHMSPPQLRGVVRKVWGEELPRKMTRQEIFDWVADKFESMAEDDKPEIVNAHKFQAHYDERKAVHEDITGGEG
jgi:hypothetical protein